MIAPRNVVLVGHCWADRMALKTLVKRALPGVGISKANDPVTLARTLDDDPILLVNRLLDGRFDTPSGVDLIRRLAADGHDPVAILISNHEDAQQEAVAAGARPGFGKAQLRDPQTADILRQAAG